MAKTFRQQINAALTKIVHKVSITNIGTLDNIDHAAGVLISAGRIEEGLALAVPLISANDTLASFETFDRTSHALIHLGGNELAAVIARWLLSLDANLGRAALNLVGKHHGSPLVLELDAASLSLTETEKVLLAHWAIGYLFIHPVTAASLALSLIRDADPETNDKIVKILFDPLLINYSGTLSEWLTTKLESNDISLKLVIIDLLAQLRIYLEGLRQTGSIEELRPSERERLIETHRQHEAARQAHKDAEKRSILASLMSRSVLLYGNRAISYFGEPGGEKQRNEMKLHTMSHSYEMPRLDILDPFDLDYTLRVFRALRSVQ